MLDAVIGATNASSPPAPAMRLPVENLPEPPEVPRFVADDQPILSIPTTHQRGAPELSAHGVRDHSRSAEAEGVSEVSAVE